ncbi:hypothetical protein FGRMN_3059 [Fusarium graminum]|nr:hypothetical protein FGRMN_3059 [Fusarium graminum]
MQFSISTVLAVLATIHTAAGWKLRAFSDSGCIKKGQDWIIREISGPNNLNDCLTFGEEMPGTSCVEENATTDSGACVGRKLIPLSVDTDSVCDFYSEPHCRGPALHNPPYTVGCFTEQEFPSFKCSSTIVTRVSLIGTRADVLSVAGLENQE